jgi:uncharacterized protein (TIGR03437 family)
VLSGTPPSGSQGAYNPKFSVTDSNSITASITLGLIINPQQLQLTLAVSPAGAGTVVANPSSSTGAYSPGTSVQLTAMAAANYSFSGWSGDLAGSTNPATLDMNAAHSVTANFLATTPDTLTITTPSLAPGLAGVIYNTTAFGVKGGLAPYSWSVMGGALPPGMSLNGGGVLSGTPQSTGSYTFTVMVVDSRTPPVSQTTSFTIVVTQPTTLLSVSSQQLNFSYSPGDPNPPLSQNIGVLSIPGPTPVTVSSATTSDGSSWLSASQSFSSTGTTPGTITVSVNPSILAPNNTYSGQITISAPSSSPSSVTVSVTLQVAAAQTPQLSVTPSAPSQPPQTFALPQGGQSQGSISVGNIGGSTLSYTAVANSDGNWLSLSAGNAGTATPSTPATVSFLVNAASVSAGLHQGTITVTDSSGNSQKSLVDLSVSGSQSSMQLSQSGLTFYAVQSASVAVPPQYVSVYNLGSGTISWSTQIQYASTKGWLTLTQPTGNSSAATPGEFQVSVNPAGLAKGTYYAVVNVLSAGVNNSPQSFSVLLNVVALGDLGSTPQVSSGGAVLATTSGSAVAATQSVNLFSPAGQNLAYSTTVFTASGGQWLSVSPQSGSLGSNGTSMTIQASAAGLTAGVYTGTVQVAFNQGTILTIQVAVVALPVGASPALRSNAVSAAASSSACTPKTLSVVLSAPVAGAALAVGQATSPNLAALIFDNCNNLITSTQSHTVELMQNGSFVNGVNFSYDSDNALWTATWAPGTPQMGASLKVYASITVSGGSGSYSGTSAPATVNILPADTSAAPQPSAPLNAASYDISTQGQVAPGGYTSIFGARMADGASQGSSPLPSTLGNSQLFLGGQPVPLLSVSGGQVNGLIPQSLASGASVPLQVQRDGKDSVIVNAQVVEFQPGIFTTSQAGIGQGAILNYESGTVAGSGSGQQAVSAGGYIEIYATGLGSVQAADGSNTTPPGDGQPAPYPSPLFQTTATATVTIGGVNAPVIYSGLAPGYVALYQVNAQVPTSAPTGTAVPVVITMTDNATGNHASSQANVTIAVK